MISLITEKLQIRHADLWDFVSRVASKLGTSLSNEDLHVIACAMRDLDGTARTFRCSLEMCGNISSNPWVRFCSSESRAQGLDSGGSDEAIRLYGVPSSHWYDFASLAFFSYPFQLAKWGRARIHIT